MLTCERLKTLLDYDPETGVFTWRVRTTNCIKVGQDAGYSNSAGYVQIRIAGRDYKAHRLAWFFMTGVWPKNDIDHINGKRDDNRIENLREATRAQNLANRHTPLANNTSGVTGVCWHKKSGKWQAFIGKDDKHIHLGLFTSIDDAKAARRAAEAKHFGEFAP